MLQLSQDTTTKVLPDSAQSLILPESIAGDRIDWLVSRGIDPDIAEIDLEMVKMKVADPDEGAGWTAEQCDDAEVEYKRYLVLCRKYPHPEHSVVPNKIMDTMWHYHILDTRAYCRDCDRVFGGYFHHFPYFGMRGDDDAVRLRSAFGKTKALYKATFGEAMNRTAEQNCWHDCADRCWHACSNMTA